MVDLAPNMYGPLNPAKVVIDSIIQSITMKDNNLSEILDLLPLNELGGEEADRLLYMLLDTAMDSDNKEAARTIIAGWNDVYPDSSDIPLTSVLFTMTLLTPEILNFVVRSFPTLTILEIFFDFCIMEDSNILSACKKVFDVFGIPPYGILNMILDTARDKGNGEIIEFCSFYVRKVSPYAAIPIWIKNFVDGPIPFEDEIEIPNVEIKNINLSKKELIEKLRQMFEMADMPEEEINKIISNKKLKEETISKVKKVLILSSLQNNEQLFRILGPAHTFTNSELQDLKYGGARMFISTEFDYDEFDILQEWFVGSCDRCLKRIRRKCHAVRKPMSWGGWSGCYCSWGCVTNDITADDLAIYHFIEYFKNMTEKIGIQDRIPRPAELTQCEIDEQVGQSGGETLDELHRLNINHMFKYSTDPEIKKLDRKSMLANLNKDIEIVI